MTDTATATALTVTENQSPSQLMAIALNAKADPEVLKKLMDLQERWDANQARKAYVEAMAAFKRDAPSVLKRDKLVDYHNGTKFRHATLGSITDQLTGLMSKHGLHASFETHTDDKQTLIKVTCHITHVDGHRESTTLSGPPDDSGKKNKIQQVGSSVTYLQRYTLLAALGIATADQDDADARDPVPMPTPKAAPVNNKPPAPPAAPPATDEEGEGTEQGFIDEVIETQCKGPNGPATRYGIKINGNVYGTFHKSHSEAAKDAKDKGYPCELSWAQKGKFKNVMALNVIKDEPATQDDNSDK